MGVSSCGLPYAKVSGGVPRSTARDYSCLCWRSHVKGIPETGLLLSGSVVYQCMVSIPPFIALSSA